MRTPPNIVNRARGGIVPNVNAYRAPIAPCRILPPTRFGRVYFPVGGAPSVAFAGVAVTVAAPTIPGPPNVRALQR
jgi:hypothetical protein